MSKSKRGILAYGAYVEENKLWIPSREVNGLFYADHTNSGHVEFQQTFLNCKQENAWNIGKIINTGEELFFFSKNAYQVWIWNKKTRTMEDYFYCPEQMGKITNIEQVRNEIWIFPDSFRNPIIIFDIKSKKSSALEWKDMGVVDSDSSPFTRTVQEKGKLYLATRKKNAIRLYEIDCLKRRCFSKPLVDLCYINCIEVKDKTIWILGRNRSEKTALYRYDINTMHLVQMIEMRNIKLNDDIFMQYFRMVLIGFRLIFIPALATNIIIYDIEKQKDEVLQYPEGFRYDKQKKGCSMFTEIQIADGVMYLFPFSTEQILSLNLSDFRLKSVNIECDNEEYIKACANYFFSENRIFYEDEFMTLPCLFYDSHREKKRVKKIEAISAGDMIYQYMRDNC